VATVWDGEVCGVRGALEYALSDSNVLILSDSQAAIAVVEKAGRTGRARTADLTRVMMDIKERQTRLGIMRFTTTKLQTRLPKPLRKRKPKPPKSPKGG